MYHPFELRNVKSEIIQRENVDKTNLMSTKKFESKNVVYRRFCLDIFFPFFYLGVVMTWEQWTQTLITSGDARVVRFWDAEKELKAFDIPTGILNFMYFTHIVCLKLYKL